ncbi:hypothetical protein SAMN05421787_10647 [Virgibacillus pantothenticus]|nr:hypothetical protein SAMN05421787_10647 [Virgibacillus pantothenticus]
MKKLYVTNQMPKGVTILLVDLEESYFEEVEVQVIIKN